MPRKKKDELITSRFFITINTNQPDDKLIKPFRATVNHILSNYDQFLKVLLPESDRETELEKIEKVKVEAGLEKGERNGFIHSHILLTVKHKTKIQVDHHKIRNFVQERLKLPGVHCNVRFIRDELSTLRDYINKNPL